MSQFVDLERNPSYQLWLATNAWQRRVRKALEPLGLTHVQFVLLSSVKRLGAEDDCITQAHCARFAAMDENMTSQTVRSLELRGLLARVDHPTDRRAHCLMLTAEGERIYAEGRVLAMAAKEAFFEPAGDRLEMLIDILSALTKADEERCGRIFQ
jgi:DNA-binding MarR family transcriptional regulator